jgi:alginate O-acetyltransferase complex protein AlgI
LVAGPIVKAKDFWPQIRAKRFGAIDWRVAWRCLLTGYFLKLVVADNLAEQTALLADPAARLAFFGPLNLLVLTYAYALQIFADFGGYSLIAIGLAALFGYRLPENFRFPYLATSVTEFWRRWHMTLSAWLRDYLYLPLGGNRKGPARTSLNLLLVMFLGGLWHGAAWKFAWWGVGHGVLLGGERLLFRRRGKLVEVPRGGWLRPLCGWCYTFHAVCLLWLPFCLPDMAAVVDYCRACGERWWVYPPVCFAAVVFGSLGVLHHAWGWLGEHRPQRAERWARPWAEGLVHGVMLFLLCTNAGAPRGFIYFQF